MALDRYHELESEASHLPTPNDLVDPYDVVSAEKGSIERRDLFGEDLAEMADGLNWSEAADNPFEAYLKARAAILGKRDLDRQLEAYVRGEIARRAKAVKPDATPAQIAATIEANLDRYIERLGPDWRAANRERFLGDFHVNVVGPTSTDYRVCRSEAVPLAGQDAEIAEWILNGEVPIHRLLRDRRDLLKPDAVAERLDWMRRNKISVRRIEEEAAPIETVTAIDLALEI
jgi:hypothetical protein